MSLEIKYSSYRIGNWGIAAIVFLILTGWFTYDGHMNQGFIDDHTVDGKPDHTLIFNQQFWLFGLPAAIASAAGYMLFRKKRIYADDEKITVDKDTQIPFDQIEAVDYTNFKSDGKFTVEYTSEGQTKTFTFSKKAWDGLDKLLELVISKVDSE
ncbi:hypothetical protein [Sedimentisphaera salicampi]|uniref:Uncharacterized protein n=1 Tax=Sedimentisphaera salicampi TaxID=1941349 RepID=A0A1W6LL72_9BACT|nr:hypothetical protein [Sedimentisphaera salicampi]ARN56538.1 hypothetical protein STSP1_00921 [Sedimentisphaera salicampi]OXU15425.1 hypothetical protein SMSP1_00906 [Sedimentisphaera salicampi]